MHADFRYIGAETIGPVGDAVDKGFGHFEKAARSLSASQKTRAVAVEQIVFEAVCFDDAF